MLQDAIYLANGNVNKCSNLIFLIIISEWTILFYVRKDDLLELKIIAHFSWIWH
jgi:hypothetical protein